MVGPPDHVAVQAAKGIIAVPGEVRLLVNDGSCKKRNGRALGEPRSDHQEGL